MTPKELIAAIERGNPGRRSIELEHGRSYPVLGNLNGEPTLEVFYYLTVGPVVRKVYAPDWSGSASLVTGQRLEFKRVDPVGIKVALPWDSKIPIGRTDQYPPLTPSMIDKLESDVDLAVTRLIDAWKTKRPAPAGDAERYIASLKALLPRFWLPYYTAMAPDFFRWLALVAGSLLG